MTKKILFVCLGNICRSPAAEAVCLQKIEEKGITNSFEVDSAGTGSWHIGKLADARMRQAASNRGILIKSRARQIHLDDFKKYDLILTMDNSNLSEVNAMAANLAGDIRAKIEPILKYSSQAKTLEVPDPYYGGERGFDEVLDLLDDAIDGLLEKVNALA